MKIKPTGDRIVIRVLNLNEQKLNKGIIMPDHITTFGGSAGVAEIVGIGSGYLGDKKDGVQLWEPLESKIGERILFNNKAGVGLTKKYRLIRESEILARIDPEGTDIGEGLLGSDDD